MIQKFKEAIKAETFESTEYGYTVLHDLDQAADACAKIAAEEIRKWSLALQSLTPGGSEYVDDPERCVQAVKDIRDFHRKGALDWARRARVAKEKRDELAVGFAEWCGLSYIRISEKKWASVVDSSATEYTTQQLLTIYKENHGK